MFSTGADYLLNRFHVVKLLNEAMDEVRKSERADHVELKGHQYTFLKNPQNLSDTKRRELAVLIRAYPNLGEAYRLKTLFNPKNGSQPIYFGLSSSNLHQ